MNKIDHAIRCAKLVQGWCKESEMRWLCTTAEKMPEGCKWVELGSWKGRSLIATGLCLPTSSTLYAVEWCAGNVGKEETTHFEARFCGWIRGHLSLAVGLVMQERPDITVEPILMDTVAASAMVRDKSVDCVFVDADHSYQGCKNDIQAWRPKLKEGGLLCGHDFGHKGVARAVKELVPDFKRGGGSIWYATV